MTGCRVVQSPFGEITYKYQIKNVKNINLRVNKNGEVKVSFNRYTSFKTVDSFVLRYAQKICVSIKKQSLDNKNQEYQREILKDSKMKRRIENIFIQEVEKAIYKYRFDRFGVLMPSVKVRYMTSRWGSCRPSKKSITLNVRLINYPIEVLEYVIVHELVHFIVCNHSSEFYHLLESLMGDWKEREKILKNGKESIYEQGKE
ncbi:MAG: M48 family metallopeptidase [Anaerovoracaceae bacterium]